MNAVFAHTQEFDISISHLPFTESPTHVLLPVLLPVLLYWKKEWQAANERSPIPKKEIEKGVSLFVFSWL